MKAGATLNTVVVVLYTASAPKEAVSITLVNKDPTTAEPVVLEISGDGGATWYEFYRSTIPPWETHQITNIALDQNDQIRGKTLNTNGIIDAVITGVEA